MSLPPALLKRLAQRGLVQNEKEARNKGDGGDFLDNSNTEENEEVIAEDYDEMEIDGHEPEEYDYDKVKKPRTDENFWAERMRARMGTSSSYAGYKGCPNKYNIWHKCTLYCLNRWEDGHPEPTAEYMRRYKRLLKKYPLPKGWSEMYDPGCGCYYFYSITENLVSWLPPTHPKSQVSKSAAILRKQLEESGADDSDAEQSGDEDYEDEEIDEPSRNQADGGNKRRSQDVPMPRELKRSLEEASANNNNNNQRKQRSRDLDRVISRQQRDRERDRDKDRERGSNSSRRHDRDDEAEIADPMDPSSYSDAPRGKWSDGLEKAQRST